MKMKSRLFLMSLCLVVLSLFVANAFAAQNSSSRVKCLKTAYNKFYNATANKKDKYAKMFLKCFPSTFSDFEKLFSFDRATGVASPLYMHYDIYFDFIGKNYSYFGNKMDEKFIKIAMGAHGSYYADAEELLQFYALAPMKDDPQRWLGFLSKYPSIRIENYWKFVLNSIPYGFDGNRYSCPMKYKNTKACKLLIKLKDMEKSNGNKLH